MKNQYGFSNGKRGAVAGNKGKMRIAIMWDDAVINAIRSTLARAFKP